MNEPPGRSNSPPVRVCGVYVTWLPAASTCRLADHVTTVESSSTERYSSGPSEPVDDRPAYRSGSRRIVPTGRRSCSRDRGRPSTSTVPSGRTVRTCGSRLPVFSARPRPRIPAASTPQNTTSSDPLMNWTHVVETMPAVTTMSVTTTPTRITPAVCGRPNSGVISDPAPTICGMR